MSIPTSFINKDPILAELEGAAIAYSRAQEMQHPIACIDARARLDKARAAVDRILRSKGTAR